MSLARARIARRGFQRGQTFTEFALVAGVFFMLLFGIIEMGLAVMTYNTICEAAREAARSAIIHGNGTGTTTVVSTDETNAQDVAIAAAPGLNLTASDVTVTFPTDSAVPSGIDVKVVISYPYTISVPGVESYSVHLTGTSQMPVSQ